MSVEISPSVVQDSLRLLASSRYELGIHFYGRLFGRYPQLETYFAASSIAQQERKLTAALRAVMQAATSPAAFDEELASLKQMHERLEVKPEYFGLFAEVLLESLRHYGGRGWTSEIDQAWAAALAPIVAALRDPSVG